MPSRILRDWTDSLKFDGISADAERLFTRLLMKADDFGRYHADPRLVRSGCFPLLETVRTEHIGRWIGELIHRKLVFRYEVGGRAFLSVVNFRQRLKQSVPKFPPPLGKDRNWLPDDAVFRELPGSSGNIPLETSLDSSLVLDSSLEEERGSAAPPPASPSAPPIATEGPPDRRRARFRPPSVDDVRSEVVRRELQVDPEAFVAFYESKGWRVGSSPMRSWQAALTTWAKRAHRNNGSQPVRSLVGSGYVSPELRERARREIEEFEREEEERARAEAEAAHGR